MAELTFRAGTTGVVGELAAAVTFLTRIPIAVASSAERTGAAAFGLVGAGLGAVASIPIILLGAGHPVPAALLSVAVLAILSGGLHLDGLADTADALAAPPGATDRARLDPRAGTAGVVAVVLVLGLQAAALAELAARGGTVAAAALVVAVTTSRAMAPVWAVTVGRVAPPGFGLGRWFAEHVGRGSAALSVSTAIVVAALATVVAGPVVAAATLGGAAAAALVGLVIIRLRGQLDGDGYGALVEITMTAVLLAASQVAG